MNRDSELWQEQLQKTALAFPYPPTPDIAGSVRRRLATGDVQPRPPSPRGRPQWRLAWIAAALLLALATLLVVPQVRAAVRDFLQIGAIRIFEQPLPETLPTMPKEIPATIIAATPLPISPLTAPAPGTQEEAPAITALMTATAAPMSARETILALAGETTLADAQSQVGFPLLLPAYPAGLGRPDHVFVQRLYGGDTSEAVIMLWLAPGRPAEVMLALYQIYGPEYVTKFHTHVEEPMVNGRRAFWLQGGHFLQLADGRIENLLFVEGNVLLWSVGDVTYRLESGLSLEEALRIAESLVEETQPAPDNARESCPVTLPADSPFTPPPPYPPVAPNANKFWYGTDSLWLMLPADGQWRQLAYGEKVFWWREGYNGSEEQQPELAMTARRLDGPAPLVAIEPPATNAYHPDFHWAMLTGLRLPEYGCWQITGHYQEHVLSFIVWVGP
jgi:hypothetical protein